MSFCAAQILNLATAIWQDINSPSNVSVGYISGVLTSSGSLGSINNKLTTCFYLSGDSPCIAGDFGASESFIYGLDFKQDYFRRAAHNALANGPSWIQLKEGDSTIVREKASDYAKAYQALAKDADDELRVAIQDYKRAVSIPRIVDAASLNSYPSP